MATTMSHRFRMNVLLDGLNLTSCFSKQTNPRLYNSPHIVKLRELRNGWAHFEDVWRNNSLFGDDFFLKLVQVTQTMDLLRNEHMPGSISEETYPQRLSKIYEKAILGSRVLYPDSVRLMDKWIEWLDKSQPFKKDIRRKMEDACVSAAGVLIQKMPAPQAQDVLEYIKKNIATLAAQPEQLLQGLESQPKTVQISVRGFVENIHRAVGFKIDQAIAAY
ncbi:MAG: hypothetical protein ACOYNL_00250 [Rickettsiales bacterium]